MWIKDFCLHDCALWKSYFVYVAHQKMYNFYTGWQTCIYCTGLYCMWITGFCFHNCALWRSCFAYINVHSSSCPVKRINATEPFYPTQKSSNVFIYQTTKNKDLMTSASYWETCFQAHFYNWQQIPTVTISVSSLLRMEEGCTEDKLGCDFLWWNKVCLILILPLTARRPITYC